LEERRQKSNGNRSGTIMEKNSTAIGHTNPIGGKKVGDLSRPHSVKRLGLKKTKRGKKALPALFRLPPYRFRHHNKSPSREKKEVELIIEKPRITLGWKKLREEKKKKRIVKEKSVRGSTFREGSPRCWGLKINWKARGKRDWADWGD